MNKAFKYIARRVEQARANLRKHRPSALGRSSSGYTAHAGKGSPRTPLRFERTRAVHRGVSITHAVSQAHRSTRGCKARAELSTKNGGWTERYSYNRIPFQPPRNDAAKRSGRISCRSRDFIPGADRQRGCAPVNRALVNVAKIFI